MVLVVVVVVPTRRLRPHVVVHSLRVLHARLDREQLLLRVLHLTDRRLPRTPEFIDLHRVRLHRALQSVEVRGRSVLLRRHLRRDRLEPLLGARVLLRLGGDGIGGDAQLLLLAVGLPARGLSGFIVVEGVLVVVVALDLSFGARLAGFIVLLALGALGAGLGLLAGLTVAGTMGWEWGEEFSGVRRAARRVGGNRVRSAKQSRIDSIVVATAGNWRGAARIGREALTRRQPSCA